MTRFSAPGSRSKKEIGKGSKRYLSEKDLKIIIKDRQKNKKDNNFLLKLIIKYMENGSGSDLKNHVTSEKIRQKLYTFMT